MRKVQSKVSRGRIGTTRGIAMYCKGKISERKIEIEPQDQHNLSHLDVSIKAEIYRSKEALHLVQ